MHIDTLELAGVKVNHHFGAKEYMKETLIPAGVALEQHIHPHDHLSVLVSGKAIVSVEGKSTEHEGYTPFVIEAGKMHGVQALTDVVWLCIHGTTDKDPATVDSTILKG